MPFLIITFSGRIVKVVNNVCTKANKVFGSLQCRNLDIKSTSVKQHAYKSLVRPSLEYACSA